MSMSIYPAGMFARQVAKITGLTEREIENLHPDDFGAPGHFKFLPGVSGGMFYTVKGLVGLIEALRLAGHVAESVSLSRWARGTAATTRVLREEPRGWAHRWEAQSL